VSCFVAGQDSSPLLDRAALEKPMFSDIKFFGELDQSLFSGYGRFQVTRSPQIVTAL
jgi:hypothetical protein